MCRIHIIKLSCIGLCRMEASSCSAGRLVPVHACRDAGLAHLLNSACALMSS
jgi:hypothetical protein